jgi:uncharacterized protein YabE (DUF348 family)
MRKKFLRFKLRLIKAQRYHLRRVTKASKHPFAVPLFVFSGLALLTLGGYFLFIPKGAQQGPGPLVVIINHDNVQQVVPSTEPTVGKLLNKLHIRLHQGDVVEPNLSTKINQDDFRINIYRAVPVEIVVGSKHIYTFSAATTPRAIATQAGIKLYPEDYVNTVPVNNFINQLAIGEQVIVNRATPVNLNLYGTPLVVRTHAKTVGALMSEKHIVLTKQDQVMPTLNTPITANMQIFLIRNGEKLQSITQTIPMPTDIIYDNSLAFGTSAVRQQGSAGQEVITYQDKLQNGVVVGRTQIQTVITVPTVTEIIVEGTNLSGIQGDMALAGIPPQDYQAVDYIVSHESGWCPTKWQGDIGYCPATYFQQYSPYALVGYGLCQSTPAIKMSYTNEGGGPDWATNPVTQLRWCNWYAHYGSSNFDTWQGALNYWMANGNW